MFNRVSNFNTAADAFSTTHAHMTLALARTAHALYIERISYCQVYTHAPLL
jgi:hypothetical protein